MADLFTLSSSALPDDVRVVSFRVHEAISAPYEITVFFTTATPDDVDLADVIGAKGSVSFDRGSGGARMHWGGVFASIENVHQTGGLALFRGLIVPPAWFLARSEHSRVFTKMTLKKIVTEVLNDASLTSADFDFHGADTPEEELVCQYRESDLAFLHRWFEREGLFYYFEQSDDGPKMIIVDKNPTESLRKQPVRYFPTVGHDTSSGEAFHRFRARRGAILSSVRLRDYDYTKPSLEVKGKADGSGTGTGELSRFGDRFFTPDDGARMARFRAEALLAKEEVYEASGTAHELRAGYEFELEQHPNAAFNKKYLVTRAEHLGVERSALTTELREFIPLEGNHTYRVEIEALDAAVTFRAAHATHWPRIFGQELAIIDGEGDSDYAQLDAEGRYLVKFMFDEGTHDDGKASTRVRMMQPHGGNPEGFHFPLRKGTEVVVIFLGGDPDRPVIAGVVPNAVNPSPVTSSNHTRNILITGGRNKIEMEDQDGEQWINIYTPSQNTEIHMGAPKEFKGVGKAKKSIQANLGEHTDGDAVFTIGGDFRINVGKEKEEHVVAKVTEDYDAAVNMTYAGPKTEDVTNLVSEHFHNGHTTIVDNARNYTVNGHVTENFNGGVTQNITPNMVQTVGDIWRHITGTSWTYAPTFNEHFSTYNTTVNTKWSVKSPDTDHHLGSWKLESGATQWKMGPMTWEAPSATLTIPSWNNTAASWFSTGTYIGSFYRITIALNSILAFSYQSIYMQTNPVAITITPAFNLALKGFYLENKGVNVVQHSAKFSFAALTSFA